MAATHCDRQATRVLQTLLKLHTTLKPTSSPLQTLARTSNSRLSATADAKTILYLAYGSNLSAETFEGGRGIQPLSAVNVHVPSLDLMFDLPGIPYIEPCFANTRYRTSSPSDTDYHKTHWKKGLIGVVYEVTPEDYRTIIATEGGGSGYHDVVVPCYVLPEGVEVVDPKPSGASFEAHTLLQPNDEESQLARRAGGFHRPDPFYAQASVRYLKLITDGGEEHALPAEYMAYLYNLRPYTITTTKQKVGQAIFLAVWFPIILFLLSLGKPLADKDGKYPEWLSNVTAVVFKVVWASYDRIFKSTFGDGERTIGDGENDDHLEAEAGSRWCEKSVRLPS